MPRTTLWRAIVLVASLSQAGAAQEQRVDAQAAARLDAIAVLQGIDSLPFLDSSRVALVAEALRAVRRQLPQVGDIPVGHDLILHLFPADSADGVFTRSSGAKRPAGADSSLWGVRVERIGIRAIDSLNQVFGADTVMVIYVHGLTELSLRFGRPMNIPALAPVYERVPEVGFASYGIRQMDGSWTALIIKPNRLHFVFARGGGDCPSGCTEWDYYYVTYDMLDRTVTLERQLLKGTTWPEPIFHWDRPTRYSINPYPTLDSLLAGLRDARWWYRQHAVHVMGMLLGKHTEPWLGAREQSPQHFNALKAAALSRRRDSYGALIERLSDADADVARLAHGYLRQLSGRTFPAGSAGIPRWRQWLRESR